MQYLDNMVLEYAFTERQIQMKKHKDRLLTLTDNYNIEHKENLNDQVREVIKRIRLSTRNQELDGSVLALKFKSYCKLYTYKKVKERKLLEYLHINPNAYDNYRF